MAKARNLNGLGQQRNECKNTRVGLHLQYENEINKLYSKFDKKNRCNFLHITIVVFSIDSRHQHQAPTDISSGPLQCPKQPKIRFPARSFGQGRPRAFNSEWYKNYKWIEYSRERDAAFCYPCRHFGGRNGVSRKHLRLLGFVTGRMQEAKMG